jgi:5-methylcytosine-specific restriction enzyme A
VAWHKTADDRRRDAETYGSPEYRRNRQAALKRAGGRCELLEDGRRCGSRDRVQVDHIIPVSRHGTHHLDNLRALCRPHHDAKTAQEGGGYRRRNRAPESDPPLQVRTQW